jgi:dolichyl-phosphate beta-glucosyltransferase
MDDMKEQVESKLSIVIPAYCEERRISATLDALLPYLANFTTRSTEVLVVAADAPDKTHEIIRAKQARFAQKRIPLTLLTPGPRVGKGRDVQYGMLRARGKYVLFMDADLATPLHHIEQFYEACKHGSDIVIGTRNLRKYRHSKFRNSFAHFGNVLYQTASGIKVEDTQCGFKMFSRTAVHLCFTKLTILGWGFDLEVLAIAKANKLSIRSFRIDDWEDKPFSTYTDKPVRIAMRSMRDFIYVAINDLRGRYMGM